MSYPKNKWEETEISWREFNSCFRERLRVAEEMEDWKVKETGRLGFFESGVPVGLGGLGSLGFVESWTARSAGKRLLYFCEEHTCHSWISGGLFQGDKLWDNDNLERNGCYQEKRSSYLYFSQKHLFLNFYFHCWCFRVPLERIVENSLFSPAQKSST